MSDKKESLALTGTCFMIIGLMFFTGCVIEDAPLRKWEMTVTSPTGDVVKTRTFRSRQRPWVDYDGEIMLDSRSREYIPDGWYAEFKEVSDE